MDRNFEAARSREGNQSVNLRYADFRRKRSAGVFFSLPRKTPAKRIYFCGVQRGRISESKSLAVIQRARGRRLTWKLGRASCAVILKISPPENRMPSITRNFVVQLGNVSVELARFIGDKAIPLLVQTISLRWIVRQRIFLEFRQDCLILSDT